MANLNRNRKDSVVKRFVDNGDGLTWSELIALGSAPAAATSLVGATGGAVNATPIPAQTVSGSWISVQLTGTWVGTVTFEGSNDGVTWYGVPMESVGSALPAASIVFGATVNGIYHGPILYAQFRARVSAYTSGTVTASAVVMPNDAAFQVVEVDTELSAAASPVDGVTAANASSPFVKAVSYGLGAANHDRHKNADAAPTTGVGVQSVSTGSGAVTTFAAGSSAISNGTAMALGAAKASHTLQVLTSAGVTAGTVQLQGSLDGVSWFNIGTAITTNAASTVFSVSVGNTPAIQVRAAITAAITGGTITALVASA